VAIQIPDKLQYLLKWETKAFAFLALTLADGSPHVTPVWFDWDGTHIIINTARGRVKDKALKRKAPVAVLIPDPKDNYTFLTLRGIVVEETEVGGIEQINKLNQKYQGTPTFPVPAGQVRVTYKILPQKVYPKE
jgi:PPOX class probable F420-dependent enzyme